MPKTSRNFTPEQINQALFQADPMHTGCQENDCFDEYQRIANALAAYMEEDGLAIEQALHAALSNSFGDDWVEQRHIDVVMQHFASMS